MDSANGAKLNDLEGTCTAGTSARPDLLCSTHKGTSGQLLIAPPPAVAELPRRLNTSLQKVSGVWDGFIRPQLKLTSKG